MYQGPTYYGRAQLKPSPFNNWVVGGYVFLAGLSGGAALISAIADAVRPVGAAGAVRRGRYLAMLAPLIGPVLLIEDLRTPSRFYNMLRVAKGTSPMSIGTWILMAFSAFAGLGAAAQFVSDRLGWLWPRRAARATQVPAAIAGAGLATYTAGLLSATSTPLWAAAPQSLAVRFGASSVAAAGAALSLAERSARTRRALDAITVAALATELAATEASHRSYRQAGVADALDGAWGQVEKIGATGLGAMLPLGLLVASLALGRRAGRLSQAASLATLAGSALLRVSIMGAGDDSARRPEISFRFSQPDNLPRA
jgi:formate-dependent nitrite reductase membrane component NrfD